MEKASVTKSSMAEAIGWTTTASLTIITVSNHVHASPEISHKRTQYKVPMPQVHEDSIKSKQPTVEDTVLVVSSDLNGT